MKAEYSRGLLIRLLESSTLIVPLPEGSVVKKSATLIAGSLKN